MRKKVASFSVLARSCAYQHHLFLAGKEVGTLRSDLNCLTVKLLILGTVCSVPLRAAAETLISVFKSNAECEQ